MVKVKICGITNKDEIEYLNILKPSYAGFVFTKSKRQVNIGEANYLIRLLDKSIKTVGVFKDNSIDEILEALMFVPLNIIQLHGKEDIKFIKELKERTNNVEIWKALSINDKKIIDEFFIHNSTSLVDMFLIDGDNPGSVETYPIEKLKEILNKYDNIEFFLAGGINSENVKDKILEIKPFGVDVSSGVEEITREGKRQKSFEKIDQFIKNVKKAKFW